MQVELKNRISSLLGKCMYIDFKLTLGDESEGMRVVRGAISLLVGPPGAGSSRPLGLEAASGWLAPPPPPPLFELPMLPLALVCWRWALEEPEAEGVDDTRERKLGITRCLKSRTSKLDRRSHRHNPCKKITSKWQNILAREL
jgi:hypothetical protein